MHVNHSVTVSAGVVCLVIALLIETVGGRQWPRVVVALVLTGATGILNGTVGPYIHRGITWIGTMTNHWVRSWIQVSVTVIIALTVLGIAAFRVWQDNIDRRTLGVVAAVPATVTLIPGIAGTIATTVVGIVPAIIGLLVAWAFRLGG